MIKLEILIQINVSKVLINFIASPPEFGGLDDDINFYYDAYRHRKSLAI